MVASETFEPHLKWCSGCELWLSIDEFTTGFRSYCKRCGTRRVNPLLR